MIKFNELRISPDGKRLIIDASIKDLPYYDKVFIDAVIIDTQDTYIANGPSTKPIFYYEVDSNANIVLPKDLNEKRIRFELDKTVIKESLYDTMFFVYIVTKGTPSADTPCGMDNVTTMGVVANLYPYYQHLMYHIKQIENSCEVPKSLIDCLLRFKSLELSIRTGNYIQAIKYWNKFFKRIKDTEVKLNCRCNG